VPLFIFLVSGIICMGSSAFYHLVKDHSHSAQRYFSKVDYAGISIMIAGSSTPPIYYSFMCNEMQCKQKGANLEFSLG
jgi:adiponectin receptor